MNHWTEAATAVAELVTALAALSAGGGAAWTYHKSAKLERAKWMKELYEKFYERSDLKEIRDLLDGEDGADVATLVKKEDSKFTDYLNFFEFLAYLWKSKQISTKEVLGLFEYYLRKLKEIEEVAAYIREPEKGFEQLNELLGALNEGRGRGK